MPTLVADSLDLPGLLGRDAMLAALDAAAAQARAGSLPLAVLTLDLDHFKDYQDQAGAEQAHAVLQQLAALLLQHRPAGSTLVHMGSDEFMLLLPAQDLAAALAVAEGLRGQVEQAFATLERALTITVGVAAAPAAGNWNARTLLALADARMTFAKRRLLPHHNLVWAGTLPSDWYLRLDIEPGIWPSL